MNKWIKNGLTFFEVCMIIFVIFIQATNRIMLLIIYTNLVNLSSKKSAWINILLAAYDIQIIIYTSKWIGKKCFKRIRNGSSSRVVCIRILSFEKKTKQKHHYHHLYNIHYQCIQCINNWQQINRFKNIRSDNQSMLFIDLLYIIHTTQINWTVIIIISQ